MENGINEVTTPGGRVGARLAKLVSDALIHTRQQLQSTQSAVAKEVFADTTNHVSDEVRAVMGHIWRAMATDPEVAQEIRPLLHALGHERGQAWAWIAGSATGAATGASIGDMFTNLLAPAVQNVIKEYPNGLLSAESVASCIARGISEEIPGVPLVEDAERGGLSGARLMYLIELARATPGVHELRAMYNHGSITRQQFDEAAQRLGFAQPWWNALWELGHSDLSLADISAMWNRSIIDEAEAKNLGQKAGYDATDVGRALELGGEPLPAQDLGEAFRRGFIDRERFQRGIVQGPLRNEWFDVLERLQFHRMLPDAAADAVNQGHMDEATGRQIAHEHGLDPDDFSVILRTAGQPPGLDFATEAYNRGLLSDADWEVMFKESRIKNRYLPLMREMRTRLVPTETIRLMYREGVVDRTEALEALAGHGFTSAWANAQLDLEDARQVAGTKELSRAQILDLYDEDLVSREQAALMLKDIGYGQLEIDWQIQLVEVNKMKRFINLAISRVRSAYIGNRIDASEAMSLLDQIGVGPMKRDQLIQLWDIEKDTVQTPLTTAQIHWAMKNGLLSDQDAYQRFLGRGYSPEDAEILVRQGGGRQ